MCVWWFVCLFVLEYSCFTMLYNKGNQLYIYIYVPLPLMVLPSTPLSCHPSRSPESTKLSSLYIRFLLAVYFTHGSVYMSIPIFQFIPPSCPHMCSLCLHLYSCSANRFICTIFQIPHIWVNIKYLFFSFWLTSLCMTDPRSIHVSTKDPVSSLFMAEWCWRRLFFFFFF